MAGSAHCFKYIGPGAAAASCRIIATEGYLPVVVVFQSLHHDVSFRLMVDRHFTFILGYHWAVAVRVLHALPFIVQDAIGTLNR